MSKRAAQNITEKDCRKVVTEREKIYDAECSGLYVSLSPTAPPTFSLKYTSPITKKRGTAWLGVYQQIAEEEGSEPRNVNYWRKAAMKLKIRIANGDDIAQASRLAHDLQAKQAGMTLGQMIDKYIDWISEEIAVRRHTEDGTIIKKKPRKKDWANTASHLNRFVRPRLGNRIASEITNRDISLLQADILAGTLIIKKGKTSKKGSVSSARHMRKAVSGLFNWGAEVGRDYVSASPCVNLPKLEKEEPRKRKLSPAEIAVLWHGLDRPDICADRKICLAIKFTLATMLRSVELLHIHRGELQLGKRPLVMIPEERVKAARIIKQPLSDLAVEIARESLGNYPWLFAGRFGTEPLSRKAMACALRGRKEKIRGKMVVKSIGICAQLGMKPFTPHDLRRTAASLMGDIKVPRSIISLCLDHTIKSDEHGEIAQVTAKHYDQAERIDEKREALQKLSDEIRRIVAEQPMRQAA